MTVLGAACVCGRTIMIACPNLADIPAAQSRMIGWGHDAHGNVRCPACLNGTAVVEPTATNPQPGQMSFKLEAVA